jgi:hypothetical protein
MYSSISNFAKDSKIITKSITIDSLFRDNPERNLSTAFEYTLPDHLKSVQSISIKSAEIPAGTIYPISETNDSNFFTIQSQNIQYTISINSGFYTKELMQLKLNEIFQNTPGLESIQYSVDPISQISIFQTIIETDISFEFQFAFLETNSNRYKKYDQVLGGYLGFQQTTPYTCSKTAPIISESTFGTCVQNYVFLNIIDFSQEWDKEEQQIIFGKYPCFNSTYTMGQISLTNPANSVFIERKYLGKGIHLKNLRISLVDKHGVTIDLNNNDFSFILEVTLLK